MSPSPERRADFLKFDSHHKRIVLNVHLQPGAKSNAIAGLHGDALKIRIAAPAIDNKANAALLAFLGKSLGVPASNINILGGLHSRHKRVEVAGATDQIVTQLRSAIAALQR